MLDIKKSYENLANTVEHHYQHIKNQHEFMRSVAIQFELAYTDFRVIEMALQLDGEQNHDLLRHFASAYEMVFQYENAFVSGGLEGFNTKFGNQLHDYELAKNHLLSVMTKIAKLQPWYTPTL